MADEKEVPAKKATLSPQAKEAKAQHALPPEADRLDLGPQGMDRVRAEEENTRVHLDQHHERIKAMGLVPQRRTIFVAPARPGHKVLDGQGSVYEDGPNEVSVNDVWANRRLRDGTLVQVAGPK